VCEKKYKLVALKGGVAYKPRMTGSEAVKIVRATGRSQAEVARLIGISPVAIQKWLHGGKPAGSTASLLLLIRERPELLSVLARLRGYAHD